MVLQAVRQSALGQRASAAAGPVVHTAHYRCNLDKRARAVNDQLRLV
jgi:hypothetical protein